MYPAKTADRHPRTIAPTIGEASRCFLWTLLLTAPLTLGGCVASTSFEQATSTAEVQLEAHRRTAEKLAATEARLEELASEKAALLATKNQLEGDLVRSEGEISEAEMGVLTAAKERDEQSELVGQLRSELARAGAHIKDYEAEKSATQGKVDRLAKDKATLEEELAKLRAEKARLEERADRCQGETEDESLFEPAEPDGADSAPEKSDKPTGT